MRTLLVLIAVALVLLAGVAIYLVATTPHGSRGIGVPLTAQQRELLDSVPAGVDSFAIIPAAATLEAKLLANPVTRDVVDRWRGEQQLPSPWMLGAADVVIWRSGKATGYALRIDPLRAMLLRAYLMFAPEDAGWSGGLLINAASPTPMPRADVDQVLALANGFTGADALVVQLDRNRGAYPPMARPAVSAVKVMPAELSIVSRARSEATVTARAFRPSFAKSAVLAVAFSSPPRLLGDLDRLVGGQISDLGDDGGMLTIYDVDTGTLLPRPKGVLALNGEKAKQAAESRLASYARLIGEVDTSGTGLLVSFDRSSLPLYKKDAFEAATWESTSWAARLDPQRLVPILERLGDSPGLRIASPRIYRSARDLRKWIANLKNASTIEASAAQQGGTEELRVRVVSK